MKVNIKGIDISFCVFFLCEYYFFYDVWWFWNFVVISFVVYKGRGRDVSVMWYIGLEIKRKCKSWSDKVIWIIYLFEVFKLGGYIVIRVE